MLRHAGTLPIETERLLLRRHVLSDAADMYENWVTDPEVCRFWQWEPHKSIDETKKLLAGYVKNYGAPDYYLWVMALKSVGQAVGYIYLSEIDEASQSVSVHYALSRKYWNRGLTTEACKAVIHFAFTTMGAKTVCSRHHADNPASGRVLEKAGMRCVRTEYRRVPGCERISGNYLFYEITRP